MSLEWQARSGSLAWSNPVSWWWGLLTLVSGVNIAVWFVLYRELPLQPAGAASGASDHLKCRSALQLASVLDIATAAVADNAPTAPRLATAG